MQNILAKNSENSLSRSDLQGVILVTNNDRETSFPDKLKTNVEFEYIIFC